MLRHVTGRVFHTASAASRRQNSVLASGRGSFGALGQGSYEDVPADKPVPVHFATRDGSSITKISAGWGHSAVLSSDGDVFIHGQFLNFRDIAYSSMFSRVSNMLKKFKPKSKQLRVNTPFKLNGEAMGKCRDVAASAAMTAIIGEDGTLYAFGDNGHEQCGVGSSDSLVWPPEPVRNLVGAPASAVALGLNHGVVLTEHGECYSWGQNNLGQLGIGLAQVPKLNAAKLIPASFFGSESVVKVSSGMLHSAALTETGAVYVWGKHMSAEKDEMTSNYHHQFSPRKLNEIPGRAVDIASSQYSTVVRTAEGKLFLLDRIPEHKRDRKGPKDYVNTAFFMRGRKSAIASLCSLDTVEGNIELMRDGFHAATLVTDTGSLFEVNASLSPRKIEVDVGDGSSLVDAVIGWEHSLFLVR